MDFDRGEAGLVQPCGLILELGDFTEIVGSTILINLKTIVRNIVESYDFNLGNEADFNRIATQELDDTVNTLAQELLTRHQMNVSYYNIDYTKLSLPQGVNRLVPSTDKQKLKDKALKSLYPLLDKYTTLEFKNLEVTCPSSLSQGTVVILTHFASDLLKHHTFRNLKLLESHTGAIKVPAQFNSKLNIDKEKRKLVPFNRFTQRVFGDGTILAPLDLKLRRTILGLFDELGVTPHTKLERLKFQIERKEPMLYVGIRDLFR
jgi:hypothetical protein